MASRSLNHSSISSRRSGGAALKEKAVKKTQTPKKLSLNRETVRDLESFDLREVQGGYPTLSTLSSAPSGEDCCITR